MTGPNFPKYDKQRTLLLGREAKELALPGQRQVFEHGTSPGAVDPESKPPLSGWVKIDLSSRGNRYETPKDMLPPAPSVAPPGRPQLLGLHDGALIGKDGKTARADVPLMYVQGFDPPKAGQTVATVIQVNGIRTTLEKQIAALPEIAKVTGMRAVGLHNATGGALNDIAQTIGDKLGCSQNPASVALATTIYNELRLGNPVHIMAHSQGALVTADAVLLLRRWISERGGRSFAETEKLLAGIQIETFGGACSTWPDGPQYVHYVNEKDNVPLVGCLAPGAMLGKGARVVKFSEGSGLGAHAFETYLRHRKPFEEA